MVLDRSHQHVLAWLAVISVILSFAIASCSTTKQSSPKMDQSNSNLIRPSSFRQVVDPADSNAPSAGIKKGKELYDTLGCAGCHAVHGFKSEKGQLKQATEVQLCAQCHRNKTQRVLRSSHMPVQSSASGTILA